VVLLAFNPAARAGLVVSVGDVSLQAGSTGLVPVYLSSDSGTTSIASTNFEFRITTSGPTQLDFMDSPDPATDATFSDANYVFFANSADQVFHIPLGSASTVNVPNDTFIGGDFYNIIGGNVTVPVTSHTLSDNLLLAYLPVTTLTTLAPTPGNTFTVSLIPSMSSMSNPTGLDGNTGFADSAGNYYAFDSDSGTVTILSSTVPEPGTFGMMLAGAIGMLSIGRRQKRRAALQQTDSP
jgi:hypothetical protein